MWQRFTERARKMIFYAQEEAGRLGVSQVDTEHLLLGLVREGDTVGMRIVVKLGVKPELIRTEIERNVKKGEAQQGQDMQLTTLAKQVINFAYDEGRQLGNSYIGTEHLLLGLIREKEGLASQVLSKLGIDLENVRSEVLALQEAEVQYEPGSTIPKFGEPLTDAVLNLTKRAHAEAVLLDRASPRLEHLVLAILGDGNSVAARMLAENGVTLENLRMTLKAMYASEGGDATREPGTA